MRQTIYSLFLRLIRIALGNAERMEASLSADEWEALINMAVKQGMVGVAFSGVEKLPKGQMPPLEVIMDWSAAVDYMEKENIHLNNVNVKVCEMFERDGKRACIIKGASLGALYPEPLRRSPGDVDVWMAGGHDAVSEYMRGKFSHVDESNTHHVEVVVNGISVEVHFLPAELHSIRHIRYLKSYYEKVEAMPWDCHVELDIEQPNKNLRVAKNGRKGRIVVPQLHVSLVIAIVHLFHHWAFEGIGMKQVLDCYWLLKQVDKADAAQNGADPAASKSADAIRSDAMRLFRKVGIGKFVAALMYVLQQIGMDEALMICPPNAKYGKRLLNDILETGIISAEEVADGIGGHESIMHKFFRRFQRVMRMMPVAPSELPWMLTRNVVRWVFSRDIV